MDEIISLVLTGSPCAGKTTGLGVVSERLRDFGCSVLIVPEVATELFSSGVKIGENGISNETFQEEVLLKQLEQEERYLRIFKRYRCSEKRILLCDRAVMDGKAYFDNPQQFDCMVKRLLSYEFPVLRDTRYLGIYHLVTAAIGAEKFYTLGNNTVRTETPEQARTLDKRIREAWSGHEHLRIIDNTTDFQTKMQRLLQAICRQIGLPVPLEIERKYLLHHIDLELLRGILDVPPAIISISQTYLKNETPGIKRRIRRRGQDGSNVYYYQEKRPVRPGVSIETGKMIPVAEYELFLRDERDPWCDTIEKRRVCFIWENQYFELDIFEKPERHRGLVLLEIELTEEHDQVTPPPFLGVVEDVTTEGRYANYVLAIKD